MKDYSEIRSAKKRCKYSKLVTLSTLLALVSPYNGSIAKTTEPLKVVVQKGDSLSSIIDRELDSKNPAVWKQVADFNNQAVDKTLEIGDILLIPGELITPQVQLVVSKPADQNDDANDKENKPNAQQISENTDNVSDMPELEKPERNRSELKDAPKEPDTQLDTNNNADTNRTLDTAPAAHSGNNRLDQQSTSQSDESGNTAPSSPPDSDNASTELNQKSEAAQAETDTQANATPGLFEVDEDSAVRALERSLVQLNALLLKPGRAEITYSFDYSLDTELEPVLVDVEGTDTGTVSQQAGQLQNEIESLTQTLDIKFGLPLDTQINLSLPFTNLNQRFDVDLNGNSIDTQDTSESGVGDFSLTLTKTLAIEKGFRPDILLDATYTGNTGSDVFGTGSEEYTLGLSATKRQDPLVFTGGVSHTVSVNPDNEITPGDVTQLSIGTLLAASPYTSLQFFFTQTLLRPAEIDNQPNSENHTTVASFSAGVSSVLGNELFLNARLGMGLVENARDFRLTFSLAKQFNL